MKGRTSPRTPAATEAAGELAPAGRAPTFSWSVISPPLASMPGSPRRYVNEFGWTMAFSVMVSMLVSFTLTPMMSSLLLKRRQTKSGEEEHSSRERVGFFHGLATLYGRLLAWSLDHRFVVIVFALAIFATAIPLNSRVGRDWIPADDQNELTLYLNMAVGTSLDANVKMLKEIVEQVKQVRGVEFVNPYIGAEITGHSHTYIRLVDISRRKFTQEDVARDIRKIMKQYPNIRSRVNWPSALGEGESYSGINVRLLGPDLEKVGEYARKVYDQLKTIPGFADVDMDLDINSPELQIQIDRQRASELGVRAADVASAVRLMIAGEDQISTYKEADEQYPVTMQLLPEQQKDPQVLARLMIPSTKVGQVRLDNIAAVQRGLSPGRINRYNRQFQVAVRANLDSDVPLGTAAEQVRGVVRKVGLPAGFTSRFSG